MPDASDLPLIALSIRQPWCWAILVAGKDIENRTWPTPVRGRILIHACKNMTTREYDCFCDFYAEIGGNGSPTIPHRDNLLCGGIVGEVDVIDCVSNSDSLWFFGPYGFVLRNARPLPFWPCKGRLGFFELEEPP